MRILNWLFARDGKPTREALMSPDEATAIIQRYGALLEHGAPTPGCVADVAKLPFPKARIKQALLVGLRATGDLSIRKILKVGYLQLADWQEGVGPTDQGVDVSNVAPDRKLSEIAEEVTRSSEAAEKWTAIADAEREGLKAELEKQGLW
jgi:hypothetical protein